MKILILSDSHNRTDKMAKVIENMIGRIDTILYLGDCIEDIIAFESTYPDIPIHFVAGNCDIKYREPKSLIVEAEAKRIFMAHGHEHNVKYSYDKIIYTCLENQVDICLFGHTHCPDQFTKEGILFFNPGSITFPRGVSKYPSYGVIDIEGATVRSQIIGIMGDIYKPLNIPKY